MINKDKSDDKTIEEVKTASSPRGKVDADPKVVNNKHNVRVKVIPLNDSMDDEDRARIIKSIYNYIYDYYHNDKDDEDDMFIYDKDDYCYYDDELASKGVSLVKNMFKDDMIIRDHIDRVVGPDDDYDDIAYYKDKLYDIALDNEDIFSLAEIVTIKTILQWVRENHQGDTINVKEFLDFLKTLIKGMKNNKI